MASEDITVTFKVSSEKKFDLTLKPSLTVLQTKETAEKECNIPVARQRLIYRGRILNDPETLASYAIASGHTIHLVESSGGQAPPTAPAPASTPSAPVPPAAGVPDLSGLLAAMGGMNGFGGAEAFGNPQAAAFGAGAQAGFPGGLDPQLFQNMMSNPQIMMMMQEVMRNPELLRGMIGSNPFLSNMAQNNPMFQNILSNPELLRAAMNPEMLQSVMGVQQAMHTQQHPPAASGMTSQSTTPGTTPTPQPTAGLPAAGMPQGFPGAFPAGGAGGHDFQAVMNRMMSDPALMQQLQGIAASMRGGAGTNPFLGGGMFGGMPPAPQTAESLAPQMQQLEDMGFIDKDANLVALQRTGGDVNAAIAWLLESGHGN